MEKFFMLKYLLIINSGGRGNTDIITTRITYLYRRTWYCSNKYLETFY